MLSAIGCIPAGIPNTHNKPRVNHPHHLPRHHIHNCPEAP